MARSNPVTVIAQHTSLVMRIEDLELFDLETGAPADLTSPDSVTFRFSVWDNNLKAPSGTATEYSGNQEGSTNAWNAVHDCTTAGDFVWDCEVVEGSDKGRCALQHVTVNTSIADV